MVCGTVLLLQTVNLPRHRRTRQKLDYVYTIQFVEIVRLGSSPHLNDTHLRICASIATDTGTVCNEAEVFYELPIYDRILPQSAHVRSDLWSF